MFFILSKIIYFLIQPLVWIVFFFAGSIISKQIIRKKKFAITGIVLLLFFSNQFLFNEISRAWEKQTPIYQPNNDTFDVAIILGGMTGYDKDRQQYVFYGNAERLFNILPLYFDGTVKKILFAGGSGSLHQGFAEAKIVEKYLLQMGVDSNDILLEKESRNTYENITFALNLCPSSNANILLSTSATHMPRALKIFHKKEVFPTPFPVDFESYENNRFDLDKLLIPNPKVMNQWYWLIHEWVGILSYKAMGYC